MIGSFSGEGGEFLLVDEADHLNRNIKVKAKMAKTKGFSKNNICRKFDIFLSIGCIYMLNIYVGVPLFCSFLSSFISKTDFDEYIAQPHGDYSEHECE